MRPFLVSVVMLLVVVMVPRQGSAVPDYAGMVDRIEAFLNEGVTLYRAGDADGAKTQVERAYFEVFENLEGPIRINVSARKNSELETAFGDIRKMIVRRDSPDTVAAKVATQLSELRSVLPKLLAGVHLQAEPSEQMAEERPGPAPVVQPHWAGVVDGIAATLDRAVAAYQAGRGEDARALIISAQFDGYKNSLLETAIRRHVSQRKDAEFNSEFARIITLVRDGEPPPTVHAATLALVEDLRRTLPGVPMVDGTKDERPAEEHATAQDWKAVAGRIIAAIGKARSLHGEGRPAQAVSAIQDTYFDIFEASGMEGRIGARDAAFKTALEGDFSRIIAQIKANAPTAEIDASVAQMAADLDKAVAMLQEGGKSPIAFFLYALLIILREGVEALLIVTAILAYLARTGNRDKERVIHNSVLVAIAASVVTAFLLKGLLNASAAKQEVLEGVTMLVAAAILFSMSFWLISKAEAQKWMAYIKGKVDHSVSSGSLWALWFTSFLAVYREGAETVLFYQALVIDADATGVLAVAIGFAVGCAILGVIYALMRFGALRLPIRPFFMITGTLLYVLAFVFAGKGMMELVEGKVIEPTLISWLPQVPLLGVFPYWQTVAPQALLILAALLSWLVLMRRRPATVAGSQ